MQEVAGVALDEVELTGGDAALVLLVVELRDVLLPADRDVARLGELGGILRVEGESEGAQGGAEDFAHVVQQGDAALEIGAVEHAVGGDRVADLAAEPAEAGGGHHVGHGVGHGGVERALEIVGIDVFEVGEFGVVERLEHFVPDEGFHHVGGGDEQVVAAGAGGELGIHRLVRIEGVDLEGAAVFLLERLASSGAR